MDNKKQKIAEYGEHEIGEFVGTNIPLFLKILYFVAPIWGIIWFLLFWNGSSGALDRGGVWNSLEKAAATTVPFFQKSGVLSKGDEEK